MNKRIRQKKISQEYWLYARDKHPEKNCHGTKADYHDGSNLNCIACRNKVDSVMTNYELELHNAKCRKCGADAVWRYDPSEQTNPYWCDNCVSRGCSCQYESQFDEHGDEIEGSSIPLLDENGRPYPCVEYSSIDKTPIVFDSRKHPRRKIWMPNKYFGSKRRYIMRKK